MEIIKNCMIKKPNIMLCTSVYRYDTIKEYYDYEERDK